MFAQVGQSTVFSRRLCYHFLGWSLYSWSCASRWIWGPGKEIFFLFLFLEGGCGNLQPNITMFRCTTWSSDWFIDRPNERTNKQTNERQMADQKNERTNGQRTTDRPIDWLMDWCYLQSARRQSRNVTTWLNFVDCTEIKAFVELTVSSTIRAGAQNLLMVGNLTFLN